MDGGMLINAEERVAYWGNKHLNVSCRDINDEEEPDLVGLERILYGVGFLAITGLRGISAWDEDAPAEEEEVDETYEIVDSQFNPFFYETAEEDSVAPMYSALGEDPFAEFIAGISDSGDESSDFEAFAGDDGIEPASPLPDDLSEAA